MNEEKNRQVRAIPSTFTVREDGEDLTIEGYFAVFNSNYEIWDGASESFAPGAFGNSISNDIRALINHDTTLVLGRVKNHTLELREDDHGIWGKVTINPNDRAAVDLYNRVKRGDVDGCSVGFDILEEVTENRSDGSIHWTITRAELYEVSACTFPAYEETNISARAKQYSDIQKRKAEAWKDVTLKKLKGEQ